MNLSQRFKQLLSSSSDRMSVREQMSARSEQLLAQTQSTIPIGQIEERSNVKVFGLLQSVTLPPPGTSGPFTATVYDGTGAVDVVWLGRRSIPGVQVGGHIVVKGVVGRHSGGLCIMNPEYRLTGDV